MNKESIEFIPNFNKDIIKKFNIGKLKRNPEYGYHIIDWNFIHYFDEKREYETSKFLI